MARQRSPLPWLIAAFALVGALGVAAWMLLDEPPAAPDGSGAAVVGPDPEVDAPRLDLEPVDQGPPPTPADPPPPREGGLVGRIVDSNRVAVTDAVVTLHEGEPGWLPGVLDLPALGLSTKVDGSGRFAFEGVKASELIVVRVSGGDFETTDSGPHAVLRDQVTDVGRVIVEPGITITGLVRGPGARPVPGAVVALGGGGVPRPGRPDPVPIAETRCDENGRFEFRHAVRAGFQLVADAPGYTKGAFSQTTSIPPGVMAIEAVIDLKEAASLSGQVVSKGAASPLAGIDVVAQPMDMPSPWYVRVTSDAEGRFTIADIPRGRVRLKADGEGWIPTQVDTPVSAIDEGVVLTLDPAGAIEGRVVDQEGRPIRAFDLQTHASNARGILGIPQGVVRVRDGGGRFRVGDLDPGHYVFEVWAKDHAVSLSTPILVKKGATVRGVEVPMQASATLAGRVVDDLGTPLPGVEISMHTNRTPTVDFLRRTAGGASWYQRTRTDDEGVYELRNVTQQVYQLAFDHPDHPPVFVDDVQAVAGRRTDVDDVVLLRPATVSGFVLDENGQPAIGVPVSLGGGVSRKVSRQTRTDGEGRYRFSRLEPGEYQIMSVREGGNPFNQISVMLGQIEVDEEGNRSVPPDVVLSPGQELEHTVYVNR